MKRTDYLCQLFSHDTRAAAEAITGLEKHHYISKVQACHWYLNIGEYQKVDELLKNTEYSMQMKSGARRGIEYRIARRKKVKNSLQNMLNLDADACKTIVNSCHKSSIILDGGLGDAIEDLSRLYPWVTQGTVAQRFLCKKTMVHALSGTIKNTIFEYSPQNTPQKIHSKILIAALKNYPTDPKEFLIEHNEKNTDNYDSFLCAWRAKGQGDNLSCWIRSISFKEVYDLYKHILKRNPKASITDISEWNSPELKSLNNIGVNIIDPKVFSVLEISKIISRSAHVITIDTALVHICAALGKKVNLLLPYFHDERWCEYLSINSSYSKYCNIINQDNPLNWDGISVKLKNIYDKHWI